MVNKHFEDKWELLKQLGSTNIQKDAIRKRIQESIHHRPSKTSSMKFHQWKSITAVSLLFVIFGGFLFMLVKEYPKQNNSSNYTIDYESFSWKLGGVTSKKTGDSLELYHKNDSIPFGTVSEVTEAEMNTIINSKPMFVNKELEHFPYKTFMYIEHVKMQDVAIRYYFFIPLTKEKWIQYTFDYPKIEYGDIFQAMSSLELKGKKPYHHDGALYVTHGYGRMIYPVDLEPISITSNKNEVYRWIGASTKAYNQYLEKILHSNGNWQKESGEGLSNTFVSVDGNEVITISLNGNELTYEYFYPNQDE
ncbi:hypothetical protein QNH20_14320 [Neobacillus sp. WH10]|uniref:hypothetical protein n=1 Tax=Neobacillus sp. WH10 TaxID=3047873 RepID=UPI0024C146A7|nr:hypothetical protein [Neobacillus sp. WH10]WHY75322.1 hypothetical protein QNH20_14320 [Neobacillus sp. WH10]